MTTDHTEPHSQTLQDLDDVWERFAKTRNLDLLNETVERIEGLLANSDVGNQLRSLLIGNLGVALWKRFSELRDPRDLDGAIAQLEVAASQLPATSPSGRAVLLNLARALGYSYEQTGERGSLDRSISILDAMAAHSETDSIGVAAQLTLARLLRSRFRRSGAESDLERAHRVGRQAIASTQSQGTGRAEALLLVGDVLAEMGRDADAVAHKSRAVEAYSASVDRRGEGRALSNLGTSLQAAGRLGESVVAHGRALDIFIALGDRHGEGRALSNLGTSLRASGRLDEAVAAHRRALDIFIALGDRHGEGRAWSNLGTSLQARGGLDEADAAYRRALAIVVASGDRYGEGQALLNLGSVLVASGREGEAVIPVRRALKLFRQLDNQPGLGVAYCDLGRVYAALRDSTRAMECFKDALATYETLGDHYSVGCIYLDVAELYHSLGRADERRQARREAAARFESVGAFAAAASSMAPSSRTEGIVLNESVKVAIIAEPGVLVEGMRSWIAADPMRRTFVIASGPDVRGVLETGGQDADVWLVDLSTLGERAVEQIRELADGGHRVVGLSADSRPAIVRAALEAGAVTYLDRHLEPDEFLDAIEDAAHDRPNVTPSMAVGLLDRVHLSGREREVLLLLFQGLSHQAIATRMSRGTSSGRAISRETVKQYIQRARDKFATQGHPARSNFSLLARCIETGLVSPSEIRDVSSVSGAG